ncbi:MAG: hypothetical protein JNM67_11180 [Bacteroidetes bacterium]|nr:hypothetical protein [Bacteroidota bacterium]
MKLKSILFSLLLGSAFTFSNAALAQKKSKDDGPTKQLDDINYRELRNMGTIIENEEVRGYYLFRREKKTGGGMASFKLDMFDVDIKSLRSIKMQRPKKSQLVEMSFNGSAFFLMMTNKKGVDMLTYGPDGKKLGEISIKKVNKYERGRIYQSLMSKEGSNASVYPTSNGFVRQTLEKNRKLGYSIEAYSNSMKLQWAVHSNRTAEKIETADIMYCSGKYIVYLKMQKKNLMTKDVDMFVVMLDAVTGDKLFEIPMKELSDLSVLGCHIDEEKNEIYLNGEYFAKGKNILNSKSEGLYMMKVDMTGKELKMVKMSWKKELLSLTVKDDEKGKSNENMRFYVHKVHIAPNGNTYIIAEQYKKIVSGTAMALNAATALTGGKSNLSNVSIKMYNMVYLVLDKDFKLIEKEVVKKKFSEFFLEKGYETMNATLLAHFMKANGWFDYQFTSVNKTTGEFSSYYLDLNRKSAEGKKNDVVLGSIALVGSNIETKRTPLNTNYSFLFVYPAKEGHVFVGEYSRSKERLFMRLEPLKAEATEKKK